jgi:hypothetical protein
MREALLYASPPQSPARRELLDIVHQAVQRPLRRDLRLPAQREPIQPLVVPQIGEHRLDSAA